MIGKVFNRYTVLGNVNNRVIIAHNPKAVEPWLDSDGDPYSGSYFSDRTSAVKEFIARSF